MCIILLIVANLSVVYFRLREGFKVTNVEEEEEEEPVKSKKNVKKKNKEEPLKSKKNIKKKNQEEKCKEGTQEILILKIIDVLNSAKEEETDDNKAYMTNAAAEFYSMMYGSEIRRTCIEKPSEKEIKRLNDKIRTIMNSEESSTSKSIGSMFG